MSASETRPSAVLALKRQVIRDVVMRHRLYNPRVFGSVTTSDDHPGSDLDLLVDSQPGTTLFDLGNLQDELEHLLGIPVDVVTPLDLPVRFRDEVLAQAEPV